MRIYLQTGPTKHNTTYGCMVTSLKDGYISQVCDRKS